MKIKGKMLFASLARLNLSPVPASHSWANLPMIFCGSSCWGFIPDEFSFIMRTLRNAAILLGLSAGVGLSLCAPAAQAQTNPFDTGCAPGSTAAAGSLLQFLSYLEAGTGTCQIGDKIYSNFDTDLHGNAQISLAENSGLQHTLTVSSAQTFTTATKFNYTITATNCGSTCLKTWQTDTLGAVGENNYNVKVDWTNDATSSIDLSLVPGPSSSFPPLRPFNPNTVSSDVTHLITNGGSLTGFTDTVTQTPGPLPILGAGAAFGFSRKLRRRIKLTA